VFWWLYCSFWLFNGAFSLSLCMYMPVYSDLLVSSLVSFWSIKFLTFDKKKTKKNPHQPLPQPYHEPLLFLLLHYHYLQSNISRSGKIFPLLPLVSLMLEYNVGCVCARARVGGKSIKCMKSWNVCNGLWMV